MSAYRKDQFFKPVTWGHVLDVLAEVFKSTDIKNVILKVKSHPIVDLNLDHFGAPVRTSKKARMSSG